MGIAEHKKEHEERLQSITDNKDIVESSTAASTNTEPVPI